MPQDPAVIQRQIEETRAELAETIDSIAEIVSPRRIAERTQEQLRIKAAELRQRYGPALGLGPGPGAPQLPAGSGAAAGGVLVPGGGQVGGPGANRLSQGGVTLVRVVRWDRVALVGGGLLLFAGGVRRRRHRSSRRG
ncbi:MULTISPECIES: DUF3618 domain-containing protein [unclassified Frankia]|uniref:DUF3618 domain-containing protein n=1 Tax=unclassified Frankia TaxID=2632575 RepID=UPI0006DC7C74|nr:MULTISPECIES: DUF3618 domain-containing protein [unclassified Frankia]KQC38748.1 hypothetical protein UK82_08135 [Frankia sp. ACN1ag]KQM07378.1 Protein of unknown function (DUF3618) [Frankia sp. CpI1-P]